MSNITQANSRGIKFKLNKYDYWDICVNQDNTDSYDFTYPENNDNCLATYIDTTNIECHSGDTELVSLTEWENACSYGLNLENIGLTGVDNGLIQYKKDRITNQEFYDIYMNSNYSLPETDKKLHIHLASGTTKQYEYPTSFNEDGSIKLNGGFYQGFFRSKTNYSILPSMIDSTWNFEFILKPEDYTPESEKTLNDKHPENKGIFFYIGTRAENKWVEMYNKDYEICSACETDEDDDFVDEELDLSKMPFNTSNGFNLDSANDDYTVSDNKFLMFDRTSTGVTTESYIGTEEVLLSYKKHKSTKNFFNYLNHTSTGYTVHNINEVTDEDENTYNSFYKDIYNNALAFKINENGSIGYRYLIKDCLSTLEGHFSILEGNSLPNIIKTSEWAKINVKIKAGNDYMKIYFYVNGKLKYITKELPKLNLHDLDELAEKTEGVAYNISVGGGTQGLAEMVLPNYMENPTNVYPLEQYFGGSFIGDIKSFKIYTC